MKYRIHYKYTQVRATVVKSTDNHGIVIRNTMDAFEGSNGNEILAVEMSKEAMSLYI